MNSAFIEKFWEDLSADIRNGQIPLPSLPEITLKTRKLLDKQDVTSSQVSRVISADAVLTTRLLRIANSPIYRGTSHIDDIKTAVTRLGNTTVRHIVTSLAMQTLYQCSLPPQIRGLLVENWEHSLGVAAIAFFLSQKVSGLNSDEAMLAGLIHDIGTLPILEYAELYPELLNDDALLYSVIDELHPRVGEMILRSWNFSLDLITAVAEHENLAYDSQGKASYTDLVIVANLLSSIGSKRIHQRHQRVDWLRIPAFKSLGLSPEESIETIKEARQELLEIQKLFTS